MNSKKFALVTGATSGIGKAIVIELIQMNYHVVAIGRNEITLKALKYMFRSEFTTTIKADVCDHETLDKIIRAQNIYFDLVVHSAGILRIGSLDNTTREDAWICMETNYHGTVNVITALRHHIKTGGHIAVISSIGCLTVLPGGFATYASSKSAISTFCEHIRDELRLKGIHLTVVYPSIISTPMIKNIESALPPVYRAFGWHSAEHEAKQIISDTLRGRKTSFTTFSDRLLSMIANLAPRTFRGILTWWINRG
jgi:short-subunit dehydrogenase